MKSEPNLLHAGSIAVGDSSVANSCCIRPSGSNNHFPEQLESFAGLSEILKQKQAKSK
jgi:hypothetical protein